MANWTAYVEGKIFSIIKSSTYETLYQDFPDVSYTTEQANVTTAKFPNIYVHLLPMQELGRDMDGEEINAVLATVQIDVVANTSKADARKVMFEVLDALKKAHFDISSMPEFTTENDVYRGVMRARRKIGSADSIE